MTSIHTTSMSDAIKTMYERRLLTRAFPRLVHSRWGTLAKWKEYGSYELRRYESMPLVSTTLTEGITPQEQDQPSITVVTITPDWYGSWVGYSDKLEMTTFDPVVSETSALLGEQAGLSIDTLVRDGLAAGLTQDYAGTATSRDGVDTTNDLIDYQEVLDNLATLMTNNTLPFENGRYILLLHPYSFATLMQDTTFVAMLTREGGENIRNGMIGSILNCDVYVTSNGKVFSEAGASSANVYCAFFLGKDAYGLAGFDGLTIDYDAGFGSGEYDNLTGTGVKPLEIIVKGLGETGLDPLNQRGTIGWKATHQETILNSAFGIRHEHATVSG